MSVNQILSHLNQKSIDLKALEQALNQATHDERLEAIHDFTPKIQRLLFETAEGQKLNLSDIVPDHKAPLKQVIHQGKNTLPAFRNFQKRFCRPSLKNQHSDILLGYNHQTFSGATGPGYFVTYEDHTSGEIVIDYRKLPAERPDEWPKIIPNKDKLGRFVYEGMVDRLRRVADHVTIGRAYKKDKPMSAWFVLVRTP